MLIHYSNIVIGTRRALRFVLRFVLLLTSFGAGAQDAVYVLKAGQAASSGSAPATTVVKGGALAQPFDLHRNLIFFPATLDGERGNFILDTGAPRLLLNRRATAAKGLAATGLGAGGEVRYCRQRVQSLEFAGRRHGRTWALALDLSAMEARTGRTIDGFIGYEQLWNRELRIDYAERVFRVLASKRRPRHLGRAPDYELPLDFVDHLPVVTLRVGKRKLRFILDTGAGTNLLDRRYSGLTKATDRQMNVQGLDGNDAVLPIVLLAGVRQLPLTTQQRTFVAADLSHLQSPGEPPLAGLLGSAFLARYCVGIDYRRAKVHLWLTPTTL